MGLLGGQAGLACRFAMRVEMECALRCWSVLCAPPGKAVRTMATAKHYVHLTLEMRREIENGVVEGRSLAWKAERLGVDATSVSREIRRNRTCPGRSPNPSLRNDCAHRNACKRRKLCNPGCRRRCPSCASMCREGGCADYERQRCSRTHRAPWVCNGCDRRPTCPLGHFTYSAKVAQAKAEERLVESRRGLDMTGHETAFLAREVKAGLAKGQSVHHIFASRDDLPCSERSFYRHVENEDIDVAKMDPRKKVRYKKRNKRRANRHEREFYRGRTYDDFLALPEKERARTVEMDCVEGADGDAQALLTLHFVRLRFQIYILLERHDSAHVVCALDWLEGLLGGPEGFHKVFGLVLTDRGSEFDRHRRHLLQRQLVLEAGHRRRLADGPGEGGAAGTASRGARPRPHPARRGRDAAGPHREAQEGARKRQRLTRK